MPLRGDKTYDKRDNGSPEWYPYIVNIAVLTAGKEDT